MGIGTAQWGYVLEAPGRPSLKVQRQFMHSVGLDMTKFGPIWHDRIEKSSTRPQNQLLDRKCLIEKAVQKGDTVFVAEPFCLGLSSGDAEWFAIQLFDRKVGLSVAGEMVDRAALPDILAEVASRQNTQNVRAYRNPELRKLPKPERKPKRRFEKKPCVYRHFHANGDLLYIGACADYAVRRRRHRLYSEWSDEIDREEVAYFETIREALDIERDAIWYEKPIYNVRRLRPKKS